MHDTNIRRETRKIETIKPKLYIYTSVVFLEKVELGGYSKNFGWFVVYLQRRHKTKAGGFPPKISLNQRLYFVSFISF